MDICLSENLLVTLVHSIRESCKKHLKCEDFTSVSGFLCFDVDGKTQHRFILSELISRASHGDGHSSSCLKAMDWHNVSRNLKAGANERRPTWKRSGKLSSSPSLLARQSRDNRVGHGLAQRGIVGSRSKGHSGPGGHFQASGIRNKSANRTFTRDDVESSKSKEKSELFPTHNISSATISITSKLSSPKLQMLTPNSACCSHTSPDFDSSPSWPCLKNPLDPPCLYSHIDSLVGNHQPHSQYPMKAPSSPKLDRSQHSSKRNDSHSRSWHASYENNTRQQKGPITAGLKRKNDAPRHLTQACSCSHSRLKDKLMVPGGKKLCQEKACSFRSSCDKQKAAGNGRKHFNTSGSNSVRRTQQAVLKSESLDSGSSDECIGSIRPLYLVQHNDELLLPCPNLSGKFSKYTKDTTNSDELQTLSNNSCEEDIMATNPPHISSLISSIIGVLSGSNSKDQQNASNNTYIGSGGLSIDNLESTDRLSLSTSSATLNTVSSLEVDLPRSCSHHSAEKSVGLKTEEESLRSSKKTGIASQQASDPSLTAKQRSRGFKWLKLFGKDGSQVPDGENLRKRNSSFTSLKRWSSMKSFMTSGSRDPHKRQESKCRKHGH